MKTLLWIIGIAGVVLFGLFGFIAVVLLRPDWFKFAPTFGANVTVLSMMGLVIITLVLAFITALSINSSANKESRDRKERFLNEILDWAKNVTNRIFLRMEKPEVLIKRAETLKGVDKRVLDLTDILLATGRVEDVIREGELFNILGFGLDAELGKVIEATLNNLKKRVKLLNEKPTHIEKTDIKKFDPKEQEIILGLLTDKTKSLDGLDLSEDALSTVLLGRNTDDIKEAALNVVNKAIAIKLSLLKS